MKRVLVFALVCSPGPLIGQEAIENWPAPRYWSLRARYTALSVYRKN